MNSQGAYNKPPNMVRGLEVMGQAVPDTSSRAEGLRPASGSLSPGLDPSYLCLPQTPSFSINRRHNSAGAIYNKPPDFSEGLLEQQVTTLSHEPDGAKIAIATEDA
jgi:hypothetical protein